MTANLPNDKAFILQIWQTEQDGEPVWQATLEDCLTGRKETFTGLQALKDYLRNPYSSEPAQAGLIPPPAP